MQIKLKKITSSHYCGVDKRKLVVQKLVGGWVVFRRQGLCAQRKVCKRANLNGAALKGSGSEFGCRHFLFGRAESDPLML
jgi:hypothetical protein